MLTGAINGTNVLLKKTMSDGRQLVVGALVTNSSNYNRNAVQFNTKSDPNYRYYIDGDEGTKSVDHSADVLFSSDEAYQEMRADYLTGNIVKYILDFGADSIDYLFKVTAFSDSNDQDSAVTTSVTFTSSDLFEQLATYVNFIDSTGANFLTSNGLQFQVKE